MAKTNERPGNDWQSKTEICRFQGMSEQVFDKTYRGLMPQSAIKKIGQRVWFHTPTYIQRLKAKWQAEVKPTGEQTDPLLAGGSDSPNLEEYRKHKARIAKVEADERERLTVQVAAIEPLLIESAVAVRRSLEIVEREFGREAVQPTVEAIEGMIAAIEKRFAHDDRTTDDAAADGDETGEAADDEGIRGN